jgi:RNase P subunit RPR2
MGNSAVIPGALGIVFDRYSAIKPILDASSAPVYLNTYDPVSATLLSTQWVPSFVKGCPIMLYNKSNNYLRTYIDRSLLLERRPDVNESIKQSVYEMDYNFAISVLGFARSTMFSQDEIFRHLCSLNIRVKMDQCISKIRPFYQLICMKCQHILYDDFYVRYRVKNCKFKGICANCFHSCRQPRSTRGADRLFRVKSIITKSHLFRVVATINQLTQSQYNVICAYYNIVGDQNVPVKYVRGRKFFVFGKYVGVIIKYYELLQIFHDEFFRDKILFHVGNHWRY